MKYFSEKLHKNFDTEQECLDAEEAYEAAQTESTKEKKKMANEIEEARELVNEKLQAYKDAREQANEILNEAREKAKAILSAASQEYEDAKKAKYEKVVEFNTKFGPYKTVLTYKDSDFEDLIRPLSVFFPSWPF